jgi:hypothetical protein
VSAVPTESQLAAMVHNDDPAAVRWFGALLENTNYAPLRRDPVQNATDAAIKATWPKFSIAGPSNDDVKRACLWDAVKLGNNGQHWTPFFQETGSCVGQGGGGAVNYLMAVEAWVNRDPEEVKWPTFLLYPYGRSRVIARLGGPGDGSFGSAFAEAIKEGIFESTLDGLPKHTIRNGGVTWGGSTETAWSWSPNGSALHSKWNAEALKNPVRTVAQASNADDVSAGLRNGYPATCASMWGGRMKCSVTEGVLLNERVDQWAHQMCCIGWQEHPKLGELYYILNSWGNPHGTDPDGGPPGGFWIKKADMEFMCRDEVFIFSNFDGFPAQQLDWADIMRW